jgi:hypothetical protein
MLGTETRGILMPVLRAPPGASFFVNRRRYSATASGEVRVDPKHAEDVAALLNGGCVATAPWFEPVPPAPPKPARPSPPTVRLKAAPHSVWQPRTGARYVAAADGRLDVAPEHVEALMRAGCVLVG